MNKIYLIGNIVHTPEMRTTQSGVSVCSFSIAVNRRYKNPQTGQTETDYFDIQAWRQLGELCGKFLEKGRKVAVIGSMQMRDYEGRDGGKRRAWDVIADEVEFLSPRSEMQEAAPVRQTPPLAMPKADAKQAMQVAQAMGFTQTDDDELPF